MPPDACNQDSSCGFPSQSRRLPLRDRGCLVWGLVWNTVVSNGLTVYRLFGGHAAAGGQPWQIVCGWPLVRRGQSRTVAVEATPGDHEGRHRDLRHDVIAESSSLFSRDAVRGLIDQKLGGHIVHLSSKRTWPPRQQLGRENRQSTGVCGASIPFGLTLSVAVENPAQRESRETWPRDEFRRCATLHP